MPNCDGRHDLPPPLIVVSRTAWEHIAKRQPDSEDLFDVDMLMHGLDRSRYPHLAALSSMTTLCIMREAPPPGLDDESLAITFVNTGNALLRNVERASEWNLLARHYFEELIKQVGSGEINTSPGVQYQVAHAHTGIGYSCSNPARTAKDDERTALYASAKDHLDYAIELL